MNGFFEQSKPPTRNQYVESLVLQHPRRNVVPQMCSMILVLLTFSGIKEEFASKQIHERTLMKQKRRFFLTVHTNIPLVKAPS